ncbi:MAG TPA: isoleucine--tRNA ligase, partial [Anaerolineae bacterium]|nr:isoleucine--tRNA ligase [Anaerolineae bacterium]
AKLLAPFTPFIAEEIYQNLVRSVEKDAPESVHLCDFPAAAESLIDGKLMADMALALRIVSMGHSARNRVGIKLRQPLAQALVKTRKKEEKESLEALREPIVEELNVKELAFIEDIGPVATCALQPRPDLLGKKYGPLFPKIRAALAAGDALALAEILQSGEGITLEVEGQEVALTPEEVEVRFEGKDGYSVAAEAGYLVAIQTEISEELLQEGLARELVRRIQTMRKEADFRIEDHINTYYQTEGRTLRKVLENFGDYIKRETLSRELVAEKPPKEAHQATFKLEGESITLGVQRL